MSCLDSIIAEIAAKEVELRGLRELIEAKRKEHFDLDGHLNALRIRSVRIREIFRIAAAQLPRLRGDASGKLNDRDTAELDKLIGRAKTDEALLAITNGINELQKYKYPADIRNLYGLLQKIIIEGPRKKK